MWNRKSSLIHTGAVGMGMPFPLAFPPTVIATADVSQTMTRQADVSGPGQPVDGSSEGLPAD